MVFPVVQEDYGGKEEPGLCLSATAKPLINENVGLLRQRSSPQNMIGRQIVFIRLAFFRYCQAHHIVVGKKLFSLNLESMRIEFNHS